MNWLTEADQYHLPTLPEIGPDSRIETLPWGAGYRRCYGLDFRVDYPELRHYLGAFDSGGQRIAMQVFTLPKADKTAFVYHGYYDHVGLFDNVLAYCLKHNMSVVAYDLPGHGLSSGERAAIDSFQDYLQVLRDAFAVAARFGLPERRVALAQSTGCAVLMSHLLSGGAGDFERAVLLAPLFRPTAWWWGAPAHALLKNLIHSLPRRFADNSDDQAFLEFLRDQDPLQPTRLPLSWVGALKDWQRWFAELPPGSAELLILQGDADETVDWRHNLPIIQDKFPGAKLQMIAGARHHLVKEGERFRAQLWTACDAFLL